MVLIHCNGSRLIVTSQRAKRVYEQSKCAYVISTTHPPGQGLSALPGGHRYLRVALASKSPYLPWASSLLAFGGGWKKPGL